MRFHQQFANAGNHLCAVQLDSGHEGLMRETSHRVFQVEAGCTERRESGCDFLGDGLWRPHVEVAWLLQSRLPHEALRAA